MNLGTQIILEVFIFFTLSFGDDFTKTFLRVPLDAVSRSIGGSNQAYPIGAIDLFINPALLGQHQQNQLQFSNIINLLSTEYGSVAFSAPVGKKDHIGVGFIGRLNSIASESQTATVKLKEYGHYQFVGVAGYSHSFDPFVIGVNLKYFQMGYDGGQYYMTGNGVSVNAGLFYSLNQFVQIGFTMESPFKIYWNDDYRESAPGRIGLGVAWSPAPKSNDFIRFLLSVERFANEPIQTNLGIVLKPLINNLGLRDFRMRAGLGNITSDLQQPRDILDLATDSAPAVTVGMGIGFNAGATWQVKIDYCFQIIEFVSNQHIVTTRISF